MKLKVGTSNHETAVAVMDRLGFHPIEEMVGMLRETFPIPDDEAVLRTMLMTDYEYTVDGARLRIRRRLAAELLINLASFRHAKLKASDHTSNTNVGVVVEIRHPGEVKATAIPEVSIRKAIPN